jgi:SAM-dependent methyltransferase
MTIENVSSCPACDSQAMEIVYKQVPDFVFQATDELWDIARCCDCRSLFLPRRPDRSGIGRYYESYYTSAVTSDRTQISGIEVNSSLLKRLANSWRNIRYGTRRRSFGLPGAVLLNLAWPLRKWIDAECRHLPAQSARDRDFRVLDVGFGDARFIKFAEESGCHAVGVEIDPKTVASALQGGLDVHVGDIFSARERFGPASFDYVTMSHVIEHVHGPREVLECASDLLRPDGILWVEWPNPESFGHMIFGSRWRDLDPPRHLCLMPRDALVNAAARVGLELCAVHHRPFVPFEVFPFSARASGTKRSSFAVRLLAFWYEVLGLLRPSRQEWLTLSFRKGAKRERVVATEPS